MNIGIIHAYPNEDILLSLKDYYVHLFIPWKDRMALIDKFSQLHHVKIHPVIFKESPETIKEIVEISKLHEIKCFLPLYEGGILISSLVSLELNLPFYTLASSLASRNKYYLKLIMQAAFIPVPESIPIYSYTPYKYVQQLLGDKVVLKIVDSMNSQAVIVVNNEQDYTKYINEIFHYLETENLDSAVDRNRFCYGKDHVKVIAQEYCDGKEVNLDVLVKEKQVVPLGIFEKAATKGPFFPESMSFYPSTLNKEQRDEIVAIATRAVNAMQIINGVAHIEIRYKGNTPKLLDMGLRPGGAYTIKAINELCNIDLILEIAKIVIGTGNSFNKQVSDDEAILYGGIIFNNTGIVKNISGFDKLVISDLKEIRVLAREGDRVVAPPFSSQPHLCYYYLRGNEISRLLEAHKLIQDTIGIQIES